MIQIASGLFLIFHGLIHLAYATPRPKDATGSYPFASDGSWLFSGMTAGTAKSVTATLGVTTMAAFVVAGVGVFADAGWWEAFALIGSAASLLVLGLFFHPWLVLGVGIDLAIAASVLWWHVPEAVFD